MVKFETPPLRQLSIRQLKILYDLPLCVKILYSAIHVRFSTYTWCWLDIKNVPALHGHTSFQSEQIRLDKAFSQRKEYFWIIVWKPSCIHTRGFCSLGRAFLRECSTVIRLDLFLANQLGNHATDLLNNDINVKNLHILMEVHCTPWLKLFAQLKNHCFEFVVKFLILPDPKIMRSG